MKPRVAPKEHGQGCPEDTRASRFPEDTSELNPDMQAANT